MDAPRLIHPTGAYDNAAIAAEIDRRLIGHDPRTRGYHEARVREEAGKQRMPLLNAAIDRAWTDVEDVEWWRLEEAKHAQPISAAGNAEWDRIALRQGEIYAAVLRRAEQALEEE